MQNPFIEQVYGGSPFGGPLGGMQPEVPGLDPSFGVQMPEMPGYDPFQFDPRANMSMPLLQAGAAMLGAGDDFMGGLGRAGSIFGAGMQQEEDRARKIHEMDYARAMDRYRGERSTAREQIGDERWGYGEETRLSENEEKLARADLDKEEAKTARRDQAEALSREYEVPRDPLESLDAWETRIKIAAEKADRQRSLEDYRRKREMDALGKGGDGTKLTSTVVKEIQDSSFIPAEQPIFETDDLEGRKGFSEKQRRETEEQAKRGFVPKMSGDKVTGYVMSPQEVRKSEAIIAKKRAGKPITVADLPQQVLYELERALAQGQGPAAIQDLIGWGMSAEEAEGLVLPRMEQFGESLEERALGEKVESGASGYRGREIAPIKPLESRRERERRLGLGGVM